MYHPQAIYRLRAAGDSRPEHMTKEATAEWWVALTQRTPFIMSEREIWSRFVSVVRIV